MTDGVLEARGGRLGGADDPEGQLVVVRLEGDVLEVFHETGSARFHAAFLDRAELSDHPSDAGTALVVESARQAISIPVRFEGAERERLDEIVRRLR